MHGSALRKTYLSCQSCYEIYIIISKQLKISGSVLENLSVICEMEHSITTLLRNSPVKCKENIHTMPVFQISDWRIILFSYLLTFTGELLVNIHNIQFKLCNQRLTNGRLSLPYPVCFHRLFFFSWLSGRELRDLQHLPYHGACLEFSCSFLQSVSKYLLKYSNYAHN